MIVLRAVLIVVLGCTFAAVAAIAPLVVFQERPVFDHAHADYDHFAKRFAEARLAFAARENRVVIDLAPVNGGAWGTACLFGGYTRPVQRMDALGAVVSQADRNRLAEPIGLRLSPVEEFEMLIAFVDEESRAHFVHFAEGVGAEGQHYEACVTKPETSVAIESWNQITPGTTSP